METLKVTIQFHTIELLQNQAYFASLHEAVPSAILAVPAPHQ